MQAPRTTHTPKTTQTKTKPPDNTIECTPTGCAQFCATCLMFLLSLTTISAMGVIAGGAFWSAQSLHRMTDGESRIQVSLCGARHDTNATSDKVQFIPYNHWRMYSLTGGVTADQSGLPLCPQFEA